MVKAFIVLVVFPLAGFFAWAIAMLDKIGL
jgi:hypothetical protein